MAGMLRLGVLGCGDYLRWEKGSIAGSKGVQVTALFDPDRPRAESYAQALGGAVAESADDVLSSADVDAVCLFVPPWVRKGLFLKAVGAGKHVIAVKPLGPTVEECAEMVRAADSAGVRCCVQYRRTGNAVFETYKDIFERGEVGRLAIFRQDWIHHYPQWNDWATDPEKNGGPFMDAMIHNLNIARYLMGRPATYCTYFSEDYAHPGLACNDTELMKLDFADGGTALLFITWAADLAVYSTEGNDREHVEVLYMITDQGWRLTEEERDEGHAIVASREGEERVFIPKPLPATFYDRFAEAVETGGPLPRDVTDMRMAYEDVKLLRDAEAHQGVRTAVDLSPA
jgi:predicted dehydrogenase